VSGDVGDVLVQDHSIQGVREAFGRGRRSDFKGKIMGEAASTMSNEDVVDMQGIMNKLCNATLVRRVAITEDLLVFRVKPDFEIPDFLPGQYVALGLPGCAPKRSGAPVDSKPQSSDKLIKRAYSVGSSPDDKDAVEFFVAVVADGILTTRLALLKEGDRLFCAKKFTGHFTLQNVPDDKNLVLVATGTGLAPFISMMRTSSTWTEGRSITVLHGVRYGSDLAYQDELKKFAVEGRPLRYLPVVSREDVSGTTRGYVQHLFSNGQVELNPERDHVLLCGNPAMIDEVEIDLVNSRGFVVHSRKVPGNLHFEKYW
jgi:ferredoxin--NADP+ reductase